MRQLDLFSATVTEPASPVENTPAAVVEKKEKTDVIQEAKKSHTPTTPVDVFDGGEEIILHSLSASTNTSGKQPEAVIADDQVPAEINSPVVSKEERIKPGLLPKKRGRISFKEIHLGADLIEVPEDEELFKKQYYSITEVARWFHVNSTLIRYWSNEFDILKPRKNRKGDRLFRPEDVKNIQLIYQLLRVKKFSIEGAKDYLKSNKKKADIHLQLTQTLQKFKSFLLELKANLQ